MTPIVYLSFAAGFLVAALLFVIFNLNYRRVNRKHSISQEDRLDRQQDTIQELQTKIALSQIKSHFLYNAL